MADVKYCYRCGRRISKEQPDCWYCGTSVHRTIRPERRCPFCDEVVREKAIKCANCGEFLESPLEVEREPAAAEGPAPAPSGPPHARVARVDPPAGTAGAIGEEPRRRLEHVTRPKLEAPTRFRDGRPRPTGSRELIRIDPGEREPATVEVVVEPAHPPRAAQS
jgi:hypothetical protein